MAKQPTDYKSLKIIWYKKLADSGFVDIEADEETMKRRGTRTEEFARPRSRRSWEAKQAYYRMATHFLNSYPFASKLDQIIWEYHVEGISIRNISKLLTKARYKHKGKTLVGKMLLRLVNTMKSLNPDVFK